MSGIKVLEGGLFVDGRGELRHMNDFDMQGAHRYYVITQRSAEVIRGWHGHRYEGKWFQCLLGGFNMAFVKVDDWEDPSPGLRPELFTLTDGKSEMIVLPPGYANCIRATEPDSILLVFSGKRLPEAESDSWRWPPEMWNGDKIL